MAPGTVISKLRAVAPYGGAAMRSVSPISQISDPQYPASLFFLLQRQQVTGLVGVGREIRMENH